MKTIYVNEVLIPNSGGKTRLRPHLTRSEALTYAGTGCVRVAVPYVATEDYYQDLEALQAAGLVFGESDTPIPAKPKTSVWKADPDLTRTMLRLVMIGLTFSLLGLILGSVFVTVMEVKNLKERINVLEEQQPACDCPPFSPEESKGTK